MLSFTLYQLGLFFRQELPGLVAQADASRDAGEFRARLEEFVARHAAAQGEAAEQIRLLIGYDGREVSELSTGEQMPVRTLELLWQFLTGRLENPEMRCDLFIDLFFQFKRLEGLELQPSQIGWAMSLARLQLEQGDLAAAEHTLARSQAHAEGSADYAGFLFASGLCGRQDAGCTRTPAAW